ncbi:TcpQ domain-containing protein [Pseudoalteromonas sp. A25]|uniref:TcpQ domain-containing protein n=1 Tax=Pseudoalteromonas sp. A25 TaxID=116092 RepID=UPI0012607371|nr:TcpQ domain-containing protein [Pseudoalteromonas sp. A25]
MKKNPKTRPKQPAPTPVRRKKAARKVSAAWFWVKHLSLAVILIASAYYFLFGAMPKMSVSTTANVAAQGFSQFYESFRNRTTSRDTERAKFVIELGNPSFALDEALKDRERAVKASSQRWTGEHQARRFESGDTLKGVLATYARQEDIELFWYLDKDYVVKHNFRVDSNFLSALYQVGRAINDDFEYEIFTFFCHRQRAAVITEKPTRFVRDNCRKLSG